MSIARGYWGWRVDNKGPATCRDLVASFDQPHLGYFQHPDPHVFAHSEKPGCRIWLDVDRWSNATQSHWHCEAIVHEFGHLMGMEDSPDPASVMHPTKYGGKVPACYEFGPAPVWGTPATSPPPKPLPAKGRRAKLRRKRAIRRCRTRYRHRPTARKRCLRRVRRSAKP